MVVISSLFYTFGTPVHFSIHSRYVTNFLVDVGVVILANVFKLLSMYRETNVFAFLKVGDFSGYI